MKEVETCMKKENIVFQNNMIPHIEKYYLSEKKQKKISEKFEGHNM